MRLPARASAALTTSSMRWLCCSRTPAGHRPGRAGSAPSRASARRSSGWKSTIEGEHPERPEVVEEPARAEQLEAAGQERGDHETAQAQEHLDRARLLEHHEDPVEHDRHQQDVDGVADAEGLERRPHRLRAPLRRGADGWPRPPARPARSRRTSWVRITWAPASTAAAVAASEPGRRRAGIGLAGQGADERLARDARRRAGGRARAAARGPPAPRQSHSCHAMPRRLKKPMPGIHHDALGGRCPARRARERQAPPSSAPQVTVVRRARPCGPRASASERHER